MVSGRLVIIALTLTSIWIVLLVVILILIARMSDVEKEEFRRGKNLEDYSTEASLMILFWMIVRIIPWLIAIAGLLYLLGL